MLFVSIILLIIVKAQVSISSQLPVNFYLKISSIVLLFCAILTFNIINFDCIGSGIAIYNGLFNINSITLIIDIFIFLIASLILVSWPNYKQKNNFLALDKLNIYFEKLSKSLNLEVKTEIKNFITEYKNLINWSKTNKKLNSNLLFNQGGAENQSKIFLNKTKENKLNNIVNYSIIILFSILGASLLISSYDLISMYLSLELQSFAVYVLATLNKQSQLATSAGLKYFLLGGLSSCLILFGSGLIYSFTGLTNIESIYNLINSFYFDGGTELNNLNIIQAFYLGLIFIFVGFFFKISAAPLHNWAPDVYDDSPSIVTIWLTIMPKLSILIFLLILFVSLPLSASAIEGLNQITSIEIIDVKFINFILNDIKLNNIIKNLLFISSLLSLIIGSIVGLSQINIKRLLAYSTISHIGFILLALAINTQQSIDSFLFYIIQYSITNLNIFLIILALSYINYNSVIINNQLHIKDIRYIDQLESQFYFNPLIALCFSICLFSMAGIPPLIGFFSKQFILYSAVQSGYYFLAFVAIFVSVISAFYYLKIVKSLFLLNLKRVENNQYQENWFNKISNLNFERLKFLNNVENEVKSSNKNNLITNYQLKPLENFAVFNLSNLDKNEFSEELQISNTHSFLISTLTLLILLFILKPALLLNSTQLLSLTLFNY